MKSLRVPVGVALLLSCIVTSGAEAQSRFYLRLGAGIASASLNDWNEDIDDLEFALALGGLPADFDGLGMGFPLLAEVGIRVTPLFTVAASVIHRRTGVDNSLSDPTGSLEVEHRVQTTSITAVVTAGVGSAGFLLGADAGVALGAAAYELRFRDFADPANDFDILGDWDGNAFTGALFFGFDRPMSGSTSFFARLGYRFQSLGELDGGYDSPQLGPAPGPPVNSVSGEPMDTDLSGVFLLAGIGFGG